MSKIQLFVYWNLYDPKILLPYIVLENIFSNSKQLESNMLKVTNYAIVVGIKASIWLRGLKIAANGSFNQWLHSK